MSQQQFIAKLIFLAIFSAEPLSTNGKCLNSFDCNLNSTLYCVPFSAVRDCIVDCPNGSDELCGENETLCDTHLKNGCGKCVPSELAIQECNDRKWINLCEEDEHFKCALTMNCVLLQWLNDGNDDCGDNSDEDPCATGLIACDGKNITTLVEHPRAFIAMHQKQKHEGRCAHGEFQCLNGKECLPVYMVLDGEEQCSDGSDENYCRLPGILNCGESEQQCSFNPAIAAFTCGCPIGYRRTDEGICRPITLPQYAVDCAELQLQYPKSPSGKYSVYDCNCPNPKLCRTSVMCDMETFDGGWTVLMQRLNTSVPFDQTREDYEKGFQLDDDNFWIGLEQMSTLTNRCLNELMIKMRSSVNNKIILIRYSDLLICDREASYRFKIGSLVYNSQPNTQEQFSFSRNTPFMMSHELNCTTKGWGWWTTTCNLMGVLTGPNIAHDDYGGMTWQGQRISAVQMLIRNKAYTPPLKPIINNH